MNMTMTNRGHDVLIKSAMLFLTVFMLTSVKLPVNKTIKNLDFNGDGKKDTFKAYNYNSSEGKITLALNGQKNRLFTVRYS